MAETEHLIAPEELKGRYGSWALVAGGTEGVGRGFSDALAAAGINLVLVARRQAVLDSVAAEIEAAHGVTVLPVATDLSVPGAADRLAEAVGDRDLGIVIFNAGSDSVCADFASVEWSHWSSLIARNVQTLAEVTHRFAGHLGARGRGAMLLVCSTGSLSGCGRLAVYTATKAFGLNLGESLWAELRHKNVDVLSIVIGSTDTPTLRANLTRAGVDPDTVPLAKPADVASASLARLASGPVFVFDELGGEATLGEARRAAVERDTGFIEQMLPV